ncbi:GTP cyclohydrolase I [Rickettsia felis str. Pedreira]|uniref:GTP cyclohydrolase 1 n=2 Tax=Rickettsia felis TaxID=42862 RepID=GCH1_RICFE|nr:GTP cyclohydrolase I FolE [Rickettsia felis]Q4ULX3.1 RecName: Full=GTP cyclohydrolase 1; AltName: Full=GTP cyclohydrolase I; Short=GTP-CH-I [Rickettsia felis URRWXCal2]AAY61450.1 GTP cyclohydrolase I [Rickettsia felis URRWXCal2]KHO02894.1 GTP cyclohydrolase [Rickettsia felis str. LSU]KHO03537.1 GTP cyclohydrolase [Rickettsia felis]KJV57853.1 GTP cyclohydrolase I [Rickettsia felis str. Pedreira]MDE8611487.1 GTP cyclohydrolase I FolE [Rickettsia felis]
MSKPTREEAKEAVRTLLKFIGEDPTREGLLKTPDRVVNSYTEIFSGYGKDVAEILNTKFYDTCNFQDFILLKDIKFTSFCEHHMLPFIGTVDIAYIPDNCIVGISKLARIVNAFSKRLQIQEKMTVQIAESVQENLKPLGVAVKISALHSCMSMRGVMQDNSVMNTMHYTGIFAEQQKYRYDFLNLTAKR